MRSFLKNLFLLLVSTFLALFLLEGGIRSLNRYLGHYPHKDPILHHSLVPHAKLARTNDEFDVIYQINSLGLREGEIQLPKPKGTYRILMLGDSYTFGIGVNLEDTFGRRLEEKLNAGGSPLHFEVINGGCSSYSPLLEYLFLVHKGLPLLPDLVVLNYDISDVQDDYKYSEIATFDERGRPVKVPPIDVQWYYREMRKGFWSPIPFLQDSELYQFVMKRYNQWRSQKKAPLFYEAAQVIAGKIEYDRDLPLRENAGDWKKYFDHSAHYLKMIRDLLGERGIPLVLTSYPYGTEVSPTEWSVGRKLRGFDDKVYPTKLFDYLADFSKEEKIPYLDTLPDFVAAEGSGPLFYPYDGHFTPAGHEVMAASLASFLGSSYLKRGVARGEL